MAKNLGDTMVLVEWSDSTSQSGWDTVEEHLRIVSSDVGTSCFTVGFLIADDDGYVAVAASIAPDHKEPLAGDVIAIPRSAIIRIRTLTAGRSRRL